MLFRMLVLLMGLCLFITGVARGVAAQSISIFGNAVPSDPVNGTDAVTLGVKVWTSEPGTVQGIRFYRAAACAQGYLASCLPRTARCSARRH